MAPRAPLLHRSRPGAPAERFRVRLDEHHLALTRTALDRGRNYRTTKDPRGSDAYLETRARFLASLGRLAAFEEASTSLMVCRFNTQLAAHSDDLTRQYFVLRSVIGRHGQEPRPVDESGWRRLDYFATQLGRLEGIADALSIAGRNVRLFPLPALPWLQLT
ncbi:MAG: hypothetical protein E6I87_13395 [Chloroflexi bacterium]|nr:MAG: hypothetical protein E6I87_13395 [Chloroflexota bacterium]